jgi:hypothetical protein
VTKYRRLRWTGHVARMEEGRGAFKISTGKPTGKILLGTLRRRWEENIRIDIKEIGNNTRSWVDSAHRDCWRALVNPAVDLWARLTIELGNLFKSLFIFIRQFLTSL